jgi:ParB/RepB/Spo0J family partition protein
MKSEISEAIQMLNASQLIACEFNPRKRRNPAADKELRQSIEARGIIQPIIARPRGNQFEIGAGHRRWEMAIAIDSDQAIVPVIVRPLDDEAFRDLVMIENLQRDDLHPLDEAEGYQLLMNEKQIDVEELAGLVNKKPAEIVASLQLMKLSDKSKELFEAGTIDTVFARALARLQPADQAGGLKQAKRQSGPTTSYSIHALRDFIGRHIAMELSHGSLPDRRCRITAGCRALHDLPEAVGRESIPFRGCAGKRYLLRSEVLPAKVRYPAGACRRRARPEQGEICAHQLAIFAGPERPAGQPAIRQAAEGPEGMPEDGHGRDLGGKLE